MIQSVFLLEDDDDDRKLFSEALKAISAPVHFTSSSNGIEALKYLHTVLIKPDIIFSDINMPLMNGIEFLRAIKLLEDLREIPVIMLTTTTSEFHSVIVSQLGARQLLVKPNDFNVLCNYLQSFILDH